MIPMSEQTKTSETSKDTSSMAPLPAQRHHRWEPASVFEEVQSDLTRLLDGGPLGLWPLSRSLRRMTSFPVANVPRVDVFERGENLIVNADLPGVKKDDIDLKVEDGDLVLRAERREKKEVKDESWYRMERSYGSLYRRLPLPEGVQADQIKADLTDGVLEVTIPKPAAKEAQAQKIAIGGAQSSS
jgi:HSP20 family protein